MSGDFPFTVKVVSPMRCNERPWDFWVSEIGHTSPRRDNDGPSTFLSPAELDAKGGGGLSRRLSGAHPYKSTNRTYARQRRAGFNRLRFEAMSLHGLFPQMDNLIGAVCHMCGVTVKCSAAYRHLLESHAAGVEPILPPPPPAPTVKLKSGHSRSRHKKDLPLPPPPPPELVPMSVDASPTAPHSRILVPQPDLQYLDDPSSAVGGEVQVCVQTGELPVVSIQETEDLPLGDNITDDIFAIMNSEGIQSADDITNVADWKNIIRDIGNMHDINFTNTPDTTQSQDLYTSADAGNLSNYGLTEADLSSLQFAPSSSPMLSSVVDSNVHNAQVPKPAAATASTPTKSHSRSKSSKVKFNLREYDPNKHCGVVTVDNPKPCTRSLTCKAHALSLRRTVEGRSKTFDILLAEHRASKDLSSGANNMVHTATSATNPAPAPVPTPLPVNIPPSLLVNTSIDLAAFNGLTAEQQVNDIYASLLNVEDPNSVLPDTSSITSLLSQPLPPVYLPEESELGEVPILSIASPVDTVPAVSALPASVKVEEKLAVEDGPPTLVPADVCWYSSCPRPLALCTFNTSHAGGAITLGKKFATVRSNIKSSLSRSQCKASSSGVNNYYNFSQNSLSLTKSVHMNSASKCNKPEVRKLIVACSATSGAMEAPHTFSELGLGGHVVNGHLGRDDDRRRGKPSLKPTKRPAPPPMLDLGFTLDPLLADEKC